MLEVFSVDNVERSLFIVNDSLDKNIVVLDLAASIIEWFGPVEEEHLVVLRDKLRGSRHRWKLASLHVLNG